MSLAVTVKQLKPTGYTYDKNTVTVTIPFVVHASEATTPDGIRGMTGVPDYGQRCPIASGLICTNVSTESKNGKLFLVTATYSNSSDGSSATKGDPEKPWNEPPVIEPIEDRKMVVITKAYASENDASDPTKSPTIAILNSAGDLFDNLPQKEIVETGIRISWAKQTFSGDVFSYENSVNSSAVTVNSITYPAQTLLLASITAWHRETPRGTDYFVFNAEIRYNRSRHRFQPLQCGWKAINQTGGSRRVYLTSDGIFSFDSSEGEPITEPILLTAAGTLLAPSQPAMQAATPAYGNFIIHPIRDWSSLAIPSVAASKRGL